MASMSAMPSSGLVGVSTQTILVRPGTDRGAHGVEVAHVGDGVLDALRLRDLVEVAVGAAVGVVGDDDVVARDEQRAGDGVLARQARGEGEPAAAALERGDALLERGAGRVGRPAVLVAAAEAADAVLLVGRDLVDRGHHRTGQGVGLLAGVDGARGEAVLVRHGDEPMPWRPAPRQPPPAHTGRQRRFRPRSHAGLRCCRRGVRLRLHEPQPPTPRTGALDVVDPRPRRPRRPGAGAAVCRVVGVPQPRRGLGWPSRSGWHSATP